jgi:hypothetical protein
LWTGIDRVQLEAEASQLKEAINIKRTGRAGPPTSRRLEKEGEGSRTRSTRQSELKGKQLRSAAPREQQANSTLCSRQGWH